MEQIVLLLLIGLAGYFLWRVIRKKNNLFTPEAITQSMSVLGLLALFLLFMIYLMVTMLRTM